MSGRGKWGRKVRGNKIGQELVIAEAGDGYIGGLPYYSSLVYVGIFINKS